MNTSKAAKELQQQQMSDFISDLRLLLNTSYTGIFRISGTNLLAADLLRLLKNNVQDITEAYKLVSITQGPNLENVITFTLPATKESRVIQLALSEQLDFFGETKDSKIVLTSPPKKLYESF